MTTPELFARAMGCPLNPGPHRCFWCGASCDERHAYLPTGTFWDLDVVAEPHSRWQCVGCTEANDNARTMAGRDKPQKTRTYTWLLAGGRATPLTKADVATVRATCLNPPPAPWALTIAESGQKHILFRTPVNTADAPPYSVQLELARVVYAPGELSERLRLCGRIAAAIGKPVLSGPLDLSRAMQFAAYHGTDALPEIDLWNRVWNEPVSRLAAFLCPNREESRVDHPGNPEDGRAGVPATAGGPGGLRGDRTLFR